MSKQQVEPTTRTLRPRKDPMPSVPATKAKKTALAQKEANYVEKKKKPTKRTKTNNKSDEPVEKISKVEGEEEYEETNGVAAKEKLTKKAKKSKKTAKDESAEKTDDVEEADEDNGEANTKANGVTEKKKAMKKSNKNKIDKDEPADKVEEDKDNDEATSYSSIYEFKVNNIQGEEVPLSKYKGHVCIIVNVASKCGHTSVNYKEFVQLHEKYADEKGLKILAFPCNQFGKQEPGDNEKICEFANKKNVKFDMFEKIEVNGKNAHPLWKYLTGQKSGPKGADIDWNFTKFLINKEGQVVERFKSAVKPLALVEELEKIW